MKAAHNQKDSGSVVDARSFVGSETMQQAQSGSFVLVNGEERLMVDSVEQLAANLGCSPNKKVKVVSIFGETGAGKSHTLNRLFFGRGRQEVFQTSASQIGGPPGVQAALWRDPLRRCDDAIIIDTEGMMGLVSHPEAEAVRKRTLLKVLAISDIIVYRKWGERLTTDVFHFLEDASQAFVNYFADELRTVAEVHGTPMQHMGASVIIFHETLHSEPLTLDSFASSSTGTPKTTARASSANTSVAAANLKTSEKEGGRSSSSRFGGGGHTPPPPLSSEPAPEEPSGPAVAPVGGLFAPPSGANDGREGNGGIENEMMDRIGDAIDAFRDIAGQLAEGMTKLANTSFSPLMASRNPNLNANDAPAEPVAPEKAQKREGGGPDEETKRSSPEDSVLPPPRRSMKAQNQRQARTAPGSPKAGAPPAAAAALVPDVRDRLSLSQSQGEGEGETAPSASAEGGHGMSQAHRSKSAGDLNALDASSSAPATDAAAVTERDQERRAGGVADSQQPEDEREPNGREREEGGQETEEAEKEKEGEGAEGITLNSREEAELSREGVSLSQGEAASAESQMRLEEFSRFLDLDIEANANSAPQQGDTERAKTQTGAHTHRLQTISTDEGTTDADTVEACVTNEEKEEGEGKKEKEQHGGEAQRRKGRGRRSGREMPPPGMFAAAAASRSLQQQMRPTKVNVSYLDSASFFEVFKKAYRGAVRSPSDTRPLFEAFCCVEYVGCRTDPVVMERDEEGEGGAVGEAEEVFDDSAVTSRRVSAKTSGTSALSLLSEDSPGGREREGRGDQNDQLVPMGGTNFRPLRNRIRAFLRRDSTLRVARSVRTFFLTLQALTTKFSASSCSEGGAAAGGGAAPSLLHGRVIPFDVFRCPAGCLACGTACSLGMNHGGRHRAVCRSANGTAIGGASRGGGTNCPTGVPGGLTGTDSSRNSSRPVTPPMGVGSGGHMGMEGGLVPGRWGGGCIYRVNLENRVLLCRKCSEDRGESVRVRRTMLSRKDRSGGAFERSFAIASWPFVGDVLECPNCGVLWTARGAWLKKNPEPIDLGLVIPKIVHKWPSRKGGSRRDRGGDRGSLGGSDLADGRSAISGGAEGSCVTDGGGSMFRFPTGWKQGKLDGSSAEKGSWKDGGFCSTACDEGARICSNVQSVSLQMVAAVSMVAGSRKKKGKAGKEGKKEKDKVREKGGGGLTSLFTAGRNPSASGEVGREGAGGARKRGRQGGGKGRGK